MIKFTINRNYYFDIYLKKNLIEDYFIFYENMNIFINNIFDNNQNK